MIQKNSPDELMHYGIKGMKWGVRRTPEQLGRHTIKKGTTMYRVTPNKEESSNGSKYVTFLAPDRDRYRGAYARGIRDQYGIAKDAPLYEKKYKLKEDLNIPSRKELQEVINTVAKNDRTQKFLKSQGQLLLKKYLEDINEDSDDYPLEFFLGPSKFNKLQKLFRGPSDFERYEAGKNKAIREKAETFVDDYMAFFGKKTIEEQYKDIAGRFGTNKTTRQMVIDELKKRGYNAMVDEAGVGVEALREGVEPLIIFESNDSLIEKNTREISKKETNKAEKRYREWSNTANSYRGKTDW